MSLLRCTGHVNLAMLHRRMVKEHDLMVNDTGFRAKKSVSYLQLGRILESVDYEVFNEINNQYFQEFFLTEGMKHFSLLESLYH